MFILNSCVDLTFLAFTSFLWATIKLDNTIDNLANFCYTNLIIIYKTSFLGFLNNKIVRNQDKSIEQIP